MTDRESGGAFSDDYHDYVFRDGKLVGDFDGMYRHSREIPWHQDELARSWSADVALATIAIGAPYASILEVGCGLGYFADRLSAFGEVDGFDISEEAVRRASARSNHIHVYRDDVLSSSFKPRRDYNLVVVRDVLWYVYHDLDVALLNIDRCVGPAGYLAIVQSFPPLDQSYVGREIINGPDALVKHFSRYRLRRLAVLHGPADPGDGPVCVLLASR